MDILKIVYLNGDIQIIISLWLLVIVIILIIAYYLKGFKKIHFLKETYEIDETNMGIGSNKIKIKPNYEDMQIASKLWVELNTRKIGIPIDFENDVIVEVYNSWYEFFKITRELIKEIPVSKIRKNDSTKKIVGTAIDVLNIGVRPHLTRWQAKFRRWYEKESKNPKNANMSPQQIQKEFPEFKELIEDMKKVNDGLIKYKDKLEELAFGEKLNFKDNGK